MQLSTMADIRNSRRNIIGFLHHSDISQIHACQRVDVNGLSFHAACDAVIAAYQAKAATNKNAGAAFEILAAENPNFRIENFRLETDTIFKYSRTAAGYVFYCKGGNKELNRAIARCGKYFN